MTTAPYTDKKWKMPGYTGYIPSMTETFAKTPCHGQVSVSQPTEYSTLKSRGAPHQPTGAQHGLDACNDSSTWLKAPEPNLWPEFQQGAPAPAGKPKGYSSIVLGDARLARAEIGQTGYTTMYKEFCQEGSTEPDLHGPSYSDYEVAKQYSPMAQKLRDLPKDQIVHLYREAAMRVGDGRLLALKQALKDRLMAKICPGNNNSFMLRKLFKQWDVTGAGKVQIEEFMAMLESFGMQLAEQEALALFCVYDPEGTAVIDYHAFMQGLLDEDYYALFNGQKMTATDYEQLLAAKDLKFTMLLKDKLMGVKDAAAILSSFDKNKDGTISRDEFKYGMMAMQVYLDSETLDWVFQLLDPDQKGIRYSVFADKFLA